tara:strand:+ start:244 stop:831 length:588 start_codon:yes stop_codon:yes gene_type:complete
MFKLKLSKTYYSKNDNVLQYKIIIFFINLEMADQLFKNDKNHILKKVQTECKNEILKNFIIECISVYENKSNSLNLNDSISSLFKNKKDMDYNNLNFFYKKLSTIYRYNHGEVQLGFLWDGSTHEEYYKNKWKEFFNKETNKMITDISFLKYILSIIVLNFSKNKISEYQYKLSTYIRKKFNIQVFKRKGVVLHS